jgi:hypothetical protein
LLAHTLYLTNFANRFLELLHPVFVKISGLL